METKTYFAYTPQDYRTILTLDSRKPGRVATKEQTYGERATIAVQVTNGYFNYGISICDEEDKFDKRTGRKFAEERMIQGFNKVPLSNYKKLISSEVGGFDEVILERITLDFLNNLTMSVYNNMSKYKRKILEFKKKNKKK